jgi:DnaJ-class molecular chaperone
MSAVATRVREPEPTLFEPSRVTLEDLVLGVWEDLRLEGRAECPVCEAQMQAGSCPHCGSELS